MIFAYSWIGSRPGSSVLNGLHYVVRHTPLSTMYLSDVDCTVDFVRKMLRGDRVAVIATAPLTKDEDWKGFRRGQILIFNVGLTYSEFYNCGEVEREGRGLCSRAFPKAAQTLVSTTSLCNNIVGTGSTTKNAKYMTIAGDGDIRDGGGGGGGLSCTRPIWRCPKMVRTGTF